MADVRTTWQGLGDGVVIATGVHTNIVVAAPTGKLHVEAWNEARTRLHRDTGYRIEGPESFEGRTDGLGRLLHEDVPTGEYRLWLDVEADDPTAALEVLPSHAVEPQIVALGRSEVRIRARLIGMFFDTEKAFLLPSAIGGIRGLKRLYDRYPVGQLLVVGHTDTQGQPTYNDGLSLERADAVAAYLTDRVDDWLTFYDTHKPFSKRWGRHEDVLMIEALPDAASRPPGDPVVWFQSTRGLVADGIAGPVTRRALVQEYMQQDGTTLPAGVELTTHGCGESFPAVKSGDEREEDDNRRVELYFFDEAIEPPPPGKISKPGSPEYPQWRDGATETYDFTAYHERTIALRLLCPDKRPIPNAPYRIEIDASSAIDGVADEDGRAEHVAVLAPERVMVRWGEALVHASEIFVELSAVQAPDEAARRRLHNLGYVPHVDEAQAVLEFQRDFELPPTGELDPATQAKLAVVHDGGFAKGEV